MDTVQSMLCLLMFQLTYCMQNKNIETRNLIIFLRSDGKLMDPSGTLSCHDTGLIDLISYRFQQSHCHSSTDCISTHEEPLPPAVESHLKQMCSLKEICSNLTFPLTSNLQRKINSVSINFRCVDKSTFIHICENRTVDFNNTLHLITSGNTKDFKTCTCWVTKGFFMTIKEIRLTRQNENKCSTAKLMINNKQFSCQSTMNGFGSVYNNASMDQPPLDAYVFLDLNSTDLSPGSIWLILEPKGTSSIHVSCEEGIRTEPDILHATTITETTEVSTTQSYMMPLSSSKPTTDGEEKKYDSSSTQTMNDSLIAVGAVLLVVSLTANVGFIIIYCSKTEMRRLLDMFRKWLQNIRRQQAQSHDTSEHESPKDLSLPSGESPIPPMQWSDITDNPVTSPSTPTTICSDLTGMNVAMRSDASSYNECKGKAIPEYKLKNFKKDYHFDSKNTPDTANLLGIENTDNS